MYLSDDENQRLAEIEHQLVADDPVLAEELSTAPSRASSRWPVAGLVAIALGLIVVMDGFVLADTLTTVVGLSIIAIGLWRSAWTYYRRHYSAPR